MRGPFGTEGFGAGSGRQAGVGQGKPGQGQAAEVVERGGREDRLGLPQAVAFRGSAADGSAAAVRQVGQGAAVEQGQGLPGAAFRPEPCGDGIQAGGQGFRPDVHAEEDVRRRPGRFRPEAPGERAPVPPEEPGRERRAAGDEGPLRQGRQQLQRAAQVRQGPPGRGGRFRPGLLPVQALLLPRHLELGILEHLGQDRLRIGMGPEGRGREQGEGQQEEGRAPAQGPGDPRRHLPEGHSQVPAFQFDPPVQVEGEAAGDVERLQQGERGDGEQAHQEVQPARPLGPRTEHRGRHAEIDGGGREEGDRRQGADADRALEQEADKGQPDGLGPAPAQEHRAAPPVARARLLLQLPYREHEAPLGAEPPPGQGSQEASAHEPGRLAQGLLQARQLAEGGPGQDVQHQAVQGGLQPPDHQGRDPEVVPEQRQEDRGKGDDRGEPCEDHRAPVRAQEDEAQVHGLPGIPQAQRHAEAFKHGAGLRKGNRRPPGPRGSLRR